MDGPGAPDRQTTQVWDLPLRLFHWALALLVVAQIVTATIGGNALEYHAMGGYAILALLLFRIVWGFVGGTHARFSDFVRGPVTVLAYVKGRTGTHAGHNPLGGWSVAAMLVSLLVQAATGLLANDDVMMEGPLVKHFPARASEIATAIHDVNAIVLLSLVVLHLAAVFFYLFVRKQNLIAPMVSGRKPGAGERSRGGGWRLGAAVLGGAAAAVYLIVTF